MGKDAAVKETINFVGKVPRPCTLKGVTSVFVALVATEVFKADFEILTTDDGAKYLGYNGDESLLRVPAKDVKEKVKEYLDSW